ncbi:hypothetical protein SAMN04488134_103190 [Amphibacillus marinus]|uniref:TspO and MBR related proteins n=1 Tax=Amphibacillus marinus TaxID=872970 RepID=A0A1H8LGK1_9BACI|nr:hypothetical protein [Amphibacillus marinus]SEO03906.1 hypothetical protein SAMN04488134_103190 [Amphibacillus marinus]
MKGYTFTFSYHGLIASSLILLPNLLWVISPPEQMSLAHNNAPYFWLAGLQLMSQTLMFACLILLTRHEESQKQYLLPASLFLFSYYLLWLFLYLGIEHSVIYLGLAIAPGLFFIFVGLWLNNHLASWFALIFTIVHSFITLSNLF